MPRTKSTTIVLNEIVQKIKNELSPIYGLKNILSAGLLSFSRMSDSDQKKLVAEVNRMAQAAREADEIVSGAEADVAQQKRTRGRKSLKAG